MTTLTETAAYVRDRIAALPGEYPDTAQAAERAGAFAGLVDVLLDAIDRVADR